MYATAKPKRSDADPAGTPPFDDSEELGDADEQFVEGNQVRSDARLILFHFTGRKFALKSKSVAFFARNTLQKWSAER